MQMQFEFNRVACMTGRPTSYTDELARYICDQIATTSRPLLAICNDEGMPCRETVYNWLKTKPDFFNKYNNARKHQSHVLIDEMIEIADDNSGDTLETQTTNGIIRSSHTAAVNRSDLRIRTRKYLAGILNHRGYGASSTVKIKSLDATDVSGSTQTVLKELSEGKITLDEANKIMATLSAGAEAIYKHETADMVAQVKENEAAN